MANLKLKTPSGGSLSLVSADTASDLTVTVPAQSGTLNIPQVDTWYLPTNTNIGSVPYYITSWSRATNYGANKVGSGMSVSSGIFTFPTTGYWQIIANMSFYDNGGANCRANIIIYTTTDNTNYYAAALNQGSCPPSFIGGACANFVFYVSDTTQCKVKIGTGGKDGTPVYYGTEGPMSTYTTFIKIA
jgi:hypothetical protein